MNTLRRLLWCACGIALVALAIDAWRWRSAIALEAAIAEVRSGQSPVAGAPAAVRFVHAMRLSDDGDSEGALAIYQDIETAESDTDLAAAARFNSANQYLRDGIALQSTEQPGRAIPLIELAKQTYRSILDATPGHGGARYNLERALPRRPDTDPDDMEAIPAENAERAATTMRGYSPGLP